MGNCCATEDERQFEKHDMKQKKAKSSRKGEGIQVENNFNEFKNEYEKSGKQSDLWTDPGDFSSDDDESDSEEFSTDKVTLERKFQTKVLFRKEFMDRVIKQLNSQVSAQYKENGPYRYR
jgi:hypothetical protein